MRAELVDLRETGSVSRDPSARRVDGSGDDIAAPVPDVQQRVTAASEHLIEAAASKLRAKAVQGGKASPTKALQGAAAKSQAAVAASSETS